MDDLNSVTALWWAVIASGIYHGINPGMGWPLAVSASLMEPNTRAMPRALGMLALGHLLAMLGILLPFSLMIVLVEYEDQIRIGAGMLVIAMGVYLLINRKHPKILARVHPARLALWSFLSALAHGAGLMLVPIYLGICAIAPDDTGHIAVQILMGNTISTAITVAIVHSVMMTLAGGSLALVIHYWLGLQFLSKTWFNLDIVWALSLILVGVIGLWSAV
jgi:hypothetical protein